MTSLDSKPAGGTLRQPVTEGSEQRFCGVYPAIVENLKDPDGQGRVLVKLPWSPHARRKQHKAWARLATLMAGNGRGTWFIPEKGDEVLVCFEAGDLRHPFVIGALWKSGDARPETMDQAGKNYIKTIRTRSGVTIRIDDRPDKPSLRLETPSAQKIVLEDSPGKVTISDSNGNSVALEASGITVLASAKIILSASLLEISAGAVTVNAGMSRFVGVVQADTVIANSVESASYTPGAGNIW